MRDAGFGPCPEGEDFGPEGEASLDLLADLATNLAEVHRAWRDMDKIGEANKLMEARVADMIQDERKDEERKDEERKDKVVYQPRDMKFGLDHVFRLADAVLPGELVPPFACPGLLGDTVVLFISDEELAGQPALILFYPED